MRASGKKYYDLRKKANGDSRRDFEINQEVTNLIMKDLCGRAQLFIDELAAYIFLEDSKRLVQIHGADSDYILLLDEYGIRKSRTDILRT